MLVSRRASAGGEYSAGCEQGSASIWRWISAPMFRRGEAGGVRVGFGSDAVW
jgi:hypothetical protein